MAKAEWGTKRICPGCATRYYDMKKNPPVCPSCGTVFDPEILMRARRGRAADKKAAAAPKPEEVIEEIPAADGEDGEDVLIEDAEELGEDGAVDDVVEREDESV
ncbi:MAG: TIGR02300 family protein [Pseudomonadota bacterium]|nr:TIGR02300 family protein [Pseudomonadota bacterium]